MSLEQPRTFEERRELNASDEVPAQYEHGAYSKMCRLLDARSVILDQEVLEQI